MSIGQFALQSTIFSTLNNDNTLTNTLGAGVFDEVLENATYPFVSIGEETAVDYSTKDLDGGEFTINIHVWSQYKGAKQTKEIMDRVHDLLHDSSLSVSGFNLINLRFEFSDILRDPDGVTRHGVMRFRAIILGS
tara:strand:+ start:21448 stop:21852 length:405 start_codon:yes stop_codon:yes gene_type:complete